MIDFKDFKIGQYIKLSASKAGENGILTAYSLHAKDNVWFGKIINVNPGLDLWYQAMPRMTARYYIMYSDATEYYLKIEIVDEMQARLLCE